MKKALLTLMCLTAMIVVGTSLRAQEVTITLLPGWTWISYPRADTLDIATALGTFTPMEGDMIKTQYGFSNYHDGYWNGSVQHFYPGMGYMYYSTRYVPTTLVFGGSTSQPQVFVTTSEPMLVTAISAMGGGEVTVNDGTYIIVKGLCWAAHENPTTNDDFYQEAESGVGSFGISMTDLNISTTYYVRAYAVTADGTTYGDQKTFTTRDGIPTLMTAEVTDITGATATCGGDITDNGGLNVTARGVCWSTSPNPTVANSHTTNGNGNGSFSSSITGLNVSTTYYVRAYATTSAGTGYGEEKTFTTRDGIPTLTTAEVTNIGSSWAYSGGNITDNGGLNVTTRGVCWSTSPSPTVIDQHTTDGAGTGNFSSTLTGLTPNTTYYVRAYATNSYVTVYGNQQSFTTESGGSGGDHAYIDLGLPSGLLWATCNVGADNPEEYGDYFAWGETTTKDTYNWSTYQYCMGSNVTLTKYCSNSHYGYNGFTDNLTTLLPWDDAATANWGGNWRMPTEEEWEELYLNTTSIWTIQRGVNGRLFTASNGNSLFLPAAGCRSGSSLLDAGDWGYYWSSSLATYYQSEALCFYFNSDYCDVFIDYYRYNGFTVRPVCSSGQNNAPIGAINGKFTINDNGDQVYFSQGNLQYQPSTNTWHFAENQYDLIIAPEDIISTDEFGQLFADVTLHYADTYSGWIDLFSWGTSGYNHGAICYQPWSTSTSYSDYYAYGNYQYNFYDQTGQADWGYNPISNGGNTANQWRTLTQPEWDYVFNTRTTNSGIRYAKANVNNVNGVILLPDDWSSSTYSLSNTNSSGASFSSNTITASLWSTLEYAGAVFLPATGYRYGTSVHDVGSLGFYWSASYYNSGSAHGVYFDDLDYYDFRDGGHSVRLVRVAE